MNKSVAKEDVKKLLLTISELNGAISNFITNSGGSMSEPKVEETVATAPAPVESAEATKVVEQAGTETVPAAAASPLPAAEETKAAETKEEEKKEDPKEEAKEAPAEEKKEDGACKAAEGADALDLVKIAKMEEDKKEAECAALAQNILDGKTQEEPAVLPPTAEPSISLSSVADFVSKALSSEDLKTAGLSEAELSVATGKSFIDLVKVMASLTQEVAQYREHAKAAELVKVTEARISELKELGIAFEGETGEATKARVSSMDEAAFASYRDGIAIALKATASTKDEKKTDSQETLDAAKASLAKLAVEVDLKPNTRSKFADLK